MDGNRDAYGVAEFCRRHGFSRAHLYSLWRRGAGPRFMQQGDRRFISCEAAAEWRQQMESATCAASSSVRTAA
jgi:hypothetical protein